MHNTAAGEVPSQLETLGGHDAPQPQDGARWFQGGGAIGAFIRRHDWSATPLGPLAAWPQSLKTAVGIMLTTRHPVFIFWGQDLVCLYNDAYAASLGPEKHPRILGMPAREAWPEAYPIVEPELKQVMAGGEATWQENNLVPIHRNGRIEEVYWTYSYGPIHDPDAPNGVGGVLALITETTKAVVSQRESETRYRSLFQSMDQGFCVLQLIFEAEKPVDYRHIEINPVFEKQTGMQDALGRTIRELVPDIEPFWFDIYGKVALTGEPVRFTDHAAAMGRWFDVYAFRIGEPQERQVAVLFSDITDRKKAEEALRRSEERFRGAFAIETVGVMFWREGLGLTEVNDAFLRMTGFSREEVLGRTWQELTPEEFHAHSQRAAEEVTAQGETIPYEKECFRKDGSRWWGLFAARKVGDEVVEFVLDITDRKQAESALRESEARFRHMADSAPALIWMSDETGHIVFANMHYDYLFGRPASEMTGSGWRDIVLPEDLPAFEKAFMEAFPDRRPIHAEVRVRDRDGVVRWLRCEGVPRFDDSGRFLGYTGCNVDITDAKVAEEHQRLLINELNHRVKNTLATVQSIASQTLRNTETASEAKRAVDSRLFALSRAHDVLTRENWESASLRDIVGEAVAPYRHEGENRLHTSGPDVRLIPRMALAIAMALQELATNAVKYGALSNATGEISVDWDLSHEEGEPRLHLRWIERGGPPVDAPARRGFGTRLLERSLASDLNGRVQIDFLPTGLVCTVDAPLPSDQIVFW